MASRKRVRRVSELVHQVISETLMFKVKDPEARKCTVHTVEVADNLRHVRVFVYVNGDEKQVEATMSALEHATGFFKKELAAQAKLKYTPEITFIRDRSLDHADNIEYLLRSLKR